MLHALSQLQPLHRAAALFDTIPQFKKATSITSSLSSFFASCPVPTSGCPICDKQDLPDDATSLCDQQMSRVRLHLHPHDTITAASFQATEANLPDANLYPHFSRFPPFL